MSIHVHTLCWNDMDMLPYFFRHYESWVEKFYFFDDGSDDGSREYLESRADVIVAPTPHADPKSWGNTSRAIHNSAWKRSIGKADWVIVTNVDEHLYQPSIEAYLADLFEAGVTVVPAVGYQMVTEEDPEPDSVLWRDHTMGAPDSLYSRMALFRPDRVLETNYTVGRHRANFEGEIVYPMRDELTNLHYKHLGVARTFARQLEQSARLGETDHANGWGGQYQWTEAQLGEYFAKLAATSRDVTRVKKHDPRLCWWRT